MNLIRRWSLFLLSLWLASWVVVSVAVPASAGNCFDSASSPANWVNAPKYVLEDCMRTGYAQAILTGIIGFLVGSAIAGAVARTLAGGTQVSSSKPATATGTTSPSKPATGAGKPADSRHRKPSAQGTEGHCSECGSLLKADARFCPHCGHSLAK